MSKITYLHSALDASARCVGSSKHAAKNGRTTIGKLWQKVIAIGIAKSTKTREEPVHRFALVSRPIKTHVMLKLLLSTNQIFRQENPYALFL